MEPLNARKALDSETLPTASESGPSQEVLRRSAAVWEGLKHIFGTSFLTLYGDHPSPLWVAEIAKLTDEQARAGLSRVAGEARDYPCNLTQFVEACRPKSGSPRFLGRPTTPRALRLGVSLARPETVDVTLAKIRERFKRPVERTPMPKSEEVELLSGPELEEERCRQLRALSELKRQKQSEEIDLETPF